MFKHVDGTYSSGVLNGHLWVVKGRISPLITRSHILERNF